MSRAAVQTDKRLKPVAGFPTQVAACAALADSGLEPEQIAARIGRDANHVRAVLRRLQVGEHVRTLALPATVLPGLREPAAARGITVAELAVELLDVIVRDDLFDALLGEPGATDA